MRLTLTVVSVLTAALLALLGVDAYVSLQRERALFEQTMRRETRLLGEATGSLLGAMWRHEGQRRALDALDAIDRLEPDVELRWVWRDAVARGRATGYHVRGTGDARRLVTYAPVDNGEARPGLIELSASYRPMERYLRETRRQMLGLTLALTTACALIALALGSWLVGRPIDALLARLAGVGRGDLARRLPEHRRGELGQLAREVNAMCGRLEAYRARTAAEAEARMAAQEQLRHADRLSTVGRLASGLAHELGTPLNIVSGRASLIAGGSLDGDAVRSSADAIKAQADRMTALMRRLLDFARRHAPAREPTDLRLLARRALELLDGYERREQVSLTLADGPPLTLAVDPLRIEQVVLNLVLNALQAITPGGAVELSLHTCRATPPGAAADTPPGDYARIDVRDDGPGLRPEDLRHVFEPFFTTKDVGEGAGLGLSIAYGIAREHDGWIDVDNPPGGGARFSVYLPRDAAPEAA